MNANHIHRHVAHPLEVELRPIGTLKPAARNARRHSERQIEQVASRLSRSSGLPSSARKVVQPQRVSRQ